MNFYISKKSAWMMVVYSLSVFAISSCWAESNSANVDISPDGIHKQIIEIGASQTVKKLYTVPKQWDAILNKVETGDSAWVSVAVELYSGADAGAKEMLGMSLAGALSNAPEVVFEKALPSIDLKVLCSSPDIDRPQYHSYELAVHELERRKLSVQKISAASLSSARDKCVLLLNQAKEHLKTYFEIEG